MAVKECKNHAIAKCSDWFCEHKKSFVKNYAIKKKELLNTCLLKKSASILEQVNKSYCCLKLCGVFATE